ncbi:MAG: epoxyqueuosine reductase QueH [Candidatus Nanoarchaeia archaeon]
MQKLILHCCCGPCATQVIEKLSKYFELVLYFYNPSIYPQEEYEKRKENTKKVAEYYGLKFYEGPYNYNKWLKIIKGYENDKEGEQRCNICISQRLEGTALKAREQGIEFFGTSLTISPHKNSDAINKMGTHIALNSNVDFLVGDFKQDNGFKKSVELSKKLGLYRQSYCGCQFSM